MATAILAAGALRYTLPASLRAADAPWLLGFLIVVMLAVLIIGDPGSIDRQATWLRVLTDVLIASITIANGISAVRLVSSIINTTPFTNSAKTLLATGGAIWLTNVIAFGLWYWDLDRGGAAARAHGSNEPAFVFPEMTNDQYVQAGWYPKFVDYLHLSFTTATAFSPDRRLSHQTMGQASHDGRRSDLAHRCSPGHRPGREHPEVARTMKILRATSQDRTRRRPDWVTTPTSSLPTFPLPGIFRDVITGKVAKHPVTVSMTMEESSGYSQL